MLVIFNRFLDEIMLVDFYYSFKLLPDVLPNVTKLVVYLFCVHAASLLRYDVLTLITEFWCNI